MTEERIKEYIVGGGSTFIVTSIGTIRDGGTRVIATTKGKYFINKEDKKLHYEYAPSDENVINDPLLVEYILKRVGDYVDSLEKKIKNIRVFLGQNEC